MSETFRTRAEGLVAHGVITPDRACVRKVAYLTKSEARKAANATQRHSKWTFHTYKCPFGDHWHITKHSGEAA